MRAEFNRFLATLDQQIPAELDVHLICDNYATHKTPSVAADLVDELGVVADLEGVDQMARFVDS